jgi:uncharacterized protein GlcG (DUF336 family)
MKIELTKEQLEKLLKTVEQEAQQIEHLYLTSTLVNEAATKEIKSRLEGLQLYEEQHPNLEKQNAEQELS